MNDEPGAQFYLVVLLVGVLCDVLGLLELGLQKGDALVVGHALTLQGLAVPGRRYLINYLYIL